MKLVNKILYQEIKPHTGKLVLILVLILLGVGFGAVTPLPFKVLIDNVLGSEPLERGRFLGKFLSSFTSKEALGFFIVFAYAIANVVRDLGEYFASVNTKKLGKDLVQGFSQKAFDNLEKLKIGYYKQQNIGDYLYRLSYDVSAFGNLLEDGLLPFATNFLYMAATIAIMFFINSKLALVSLAVIPLLAIGLSIFNKRIDEATDKSEHSNSLLFSFIEEALNQLKNIQAFNREKKQLETLDQKESVALSNELTVYGLDFLLTLMIGIIVAIGYSVVLVYGIRLVSIAQVTTGLLIVFIFYLDNLTYPLINLLGAATAFRQQYIRVSRMGEFFDPELHIRDTGETYTITEPNIVFNKVTVYGGEEVPILNNASFEIPIGKTTVIAGVSGSGKTTVAGLILRFLDHDKGKILIGGKDIKDYSVKSLRDEISYVPQEIVLFNESIRENVTFGNKNVEFEDIKRATKLAVADKFIEQIPQGYNFIVGEEGTNLSGGQRQRILLARAFLKDKAKILIFDEPISSLDVKTRAEVVRNINLFSRNKTAIIITNILEFIHQADHVIVLNEGAVMYEGNSKALREGGVYHLILRA